MAASKESIKVLLTGGSGYIGGRFVNYTSPLSGLRLTNTVDYSVLSTLLSSPDPNVQSIQYSVLLRNPAQYSYFEEKNIKVFPFKNLEDVDTIKQVASEHDVVINCGPGFATNSARALIQGLGERRRQHANRKHIFMMHLSGTSNVGDRPVTKKFVEPRYAEGRAFLDTEDIDSYHRMREALEQYPQRTTDVVVVDTGIQENIPTYILMPPTIYGKGTGNFNKRSIQIPVMCHASLRCRQSVVVGDGSGVIDHVHVVDLAQLYENMLWALLAGTKLPSGKDGIYFCETGRHSWREIAEGVAKAGTEDGVLDTDEVRSVSLEEGSGFFEGSLAEVITPDIAELTLAMTGLTQTTKARGLWEPTYTKKDFLDSLRDELEVARGLHE